MTKNNSHHFGFVVISGPPNIGKSTLLNRLIGKKIAITSRKPQTTRHRILGIKTMPNAQMVFVDTPGIHCHEKQALNKIINRTAINSLAGVDIILFVIDFKGWSNSHISAFKRIRAHNQPVILLINKIDKLKHKQFLLPLIAASEKLYQFAAIVPISAKTGKNLDQMIHVIKGMLPYGDAEFPLDQITDKGEYFQVSELIREQLFRTLGQELPYQTAVEINHIKPRENGLLYIDAIIWVDKKGHKSIVIGKDGAQLKMIGTKARQQIENQLESRVYLELWVQVRKGWADNLALLKSLGYTEE